MYLKMAVYVIECLNVYVIEYIDLIASKAHARTIKYNKIMFDLSFKNQWLLLQIVLDYQSKAVCLVQNATVSLKTLCAQIDTRSLYLKWLAL